MFSVRRKFAVDALTTQVQCFLSRYHAGCIRTPCNIIFPVGVRKKPTNNTKKVWLEVVSAVSNRSVVSATP